MIFLHRDPSLKAKKKPAKKSKKGKEEEDEEEEDEEEAEEEEETAADGETLAPAYARKSGKHKGSNAGLKAFVIAQITGIVEASGASKKGAKLPSALKVRKEGSDTLNEISRPGWLKPCQLPFPF